MFQIQKDSCQYRSSGKNQSQFQDDIIENTNFALNKKRSELFKDFRGVDEDTKIHGKHVSTGNIGIWKNHISDDLHGFYLASEINEKNDEWNKLILK